MKILITGINGFIGQYLAKELIERGHFVSGIGREKKCKVKSVNKYYSGSVLDQKFIKKIVSTNEIIVHLAALTTHEDIIVNKFETLQTNFAGTQNVLDAFSRSKITKKFIYSSTGKVYGKIINLPISEDHPTNPLNILGKSKLITEKLIDFYAAASLSTSKKEFIIFRIFNIYGLKQKNNFIIPTIISQLKAKDNSITLGDIEAKRDYVYIDDLIMAFVLAIENKSTKDISIFNICTGVGTSAAQIVKIIEKIIAKKIFIKKNKALLRSDEMKNEYGSFEKIKKAFGWQAKYTLEQGLKKIIN